MEAYWTWWLAAVVLVIAEMFSGTFYLIAVAFGLAAGGLAAYLGIDWTGQTVVAALLCTLGVVAIFRWRKGQTAPSGQVNLAYDIGQEVQVARWSGERHLRVNYRGAEWDAELAETVVPDTARTSWRIRRVEGSRLIVE